MCNPTPNSSRNGGRGGNLVRREVEGWEVVQRRRSSQRLPGESVWTSVRVLDLGLVSAPLLLLLLLFYKKLFWLRHAACEILVPQPGIEPAPPVLEAWSLNHWTSREVPAPLLLSCLTWNKSLVLSGWGLVVFADLEGHFQFRR